MSTAYSDSEIMQQIREKYGTGTDFEGASPAPGAIQDGIRPGESESGQSGESTSGREDQVGRKPRKIRRDVGVARGNYRRKGRTDTAAYESNSRDNRSGGSTNGEIQRNQRESGRIEDAKEEDKPSGLDTRPNAKERKIRAEQEAAEQAKRSAAEQEASQPQSFFAWIRPNHNRKANKEEKQSSIRSKPLTNKEAEDIRQPLIDAMIDYFKYADELLSGTSANGAEALIWSSIDDEEIGILIDAWLARAKVDPVAAHYAVEAVNSHYKLKVLMILGPRFYKTFRFYVDNGVRSPFPQTRRKQQREKQRRPLAVVRDN